MKKQVLIALCAVCMTQLSAQITPEERAQIDKMTPEQSAKDWNANLDEERQEGIISQQEYDQLKTTEEEPLFPKPQTNGDTLG